MSFSFCPPLPSDGLPLTHSPRREVVSGSVTRRVPTPRLLGVLLWQFGNGLLGCQPGVVREPSSLLGSSRVSSLTTFESGRESLRLLRFRERYSSLRSSSPAGVVPRSSSTDEEMFVDELRASCRNVNCRRRSSTFFYKPTCASAWSVKEHNISKDGWPVSTLTPV